MAENESDKDSKIWKKFLRRHWKAAAIIVAGIALAVLGAILVYLWFVGQAQLNGIVPGSLGLWAMGNLVSFLLNLAFWELLLIGIPVVLAIIVAYTQYRKLPADERDEYRRANLFGSSSRRRDWNNGLSFLVFIVFIIKVYADGNWNVPFSSWTFDYLVYSGIFALLVVLLVLGIPALLGGGWWLRREMKRHP